MNVEGYNGVGDLARVTLWYVQGVEGEYYTTKLAAEARARKAFPIEGPDCRYARIFFRNFWMEV